MKRGGKDWLRQCCKGGINETGELFIPDWLVCADQPGHASPLTGIHGTPFWKRLTTGAAIDI